MRTVAIKKFIQFSIFFIALSLVSQIEAMTVSPYADQGGPMNGPPGGTVYLNTPNGGSTTTTTGGTTTSTTTGSTISPTTQGQIQSATQMPPAASGGTTTTGTASQSTTPSVDSTGVSLPTVTTPLTSATATVSVFHYITNAQSTAQISCPNGSQLTESGFYTNVVANGSNQGNILYFKCNETYATNSQYYLYLTTQPWIECDMNKVPPNEVYQYGNCSIVMQKPPLVRMFIIVPQTSSVRNGNLSGSGDHLLFWDAALYVNTNRISYVNAGYEEPIYITYLFDPSDQFSVTTQTQTQQFEWQIVGPQVQSGNPQQSSAWDMQPDSGSSHWGTYFCQRGTGIITPGMLGKTCSFTCQGPYDFYPGAEPYFSSLAFNDAYQSASSPTGTTWTGDNFWGVDPVMKCK